MNNSIHFKMSQTSDEDVKPIIIESFNILLDGYVAENNKFKALAYRKALKELEKVKEIHSINDIQTLTGFGKSLTSKVDEIIKTHHLKAAEEAQNSESTIAVKELMTVHGVGIQKARSLIEMGIMNIDSLRTESEKNPSLLHDQQKIGLKYYNDMKFRIPQDEMRKHFNFLQNEIKKLSTTASLQVVGSFRRNSPDSGDIDVLITDYPDNPKLLPKFLDMLRKAKYLTENTTLSQGIVKFCGICKLLSASADSPVRRIDVLYTHPYEYPFALLYFTGSGDFNKEMRAYALQKGYSLNQKNIQHKDTAIIVDVEEHTFRNEKDIFDFLELQYIEPQDRYPGKVIPTEQ